MIETAELTDEGRARKEIVLAPYGWKEGVPAGPNSTQDKILYYVDLWKKRQFQPGDKGEGIPVLYVQGGVGAGKTRGILAPILELMCQHPGIRVLWGRKDFSDLRVSAMETFLEVAQGLIASKNEQEHRYSIINAGQKTGILSKIFFRELKDLAGLGSQEFAIIVITEAHEIFNHRIYTDLKARCRQADMPLMLLMEGNPPNEGHWLDNLTKRGSPEYDDDVVQLICTTYENWNNLPVSYRRSLEKMSPAWRRKYIEGKSGFIPDGKPFYDGFNEQLHCGDFEYIKGKEIIRCLDFGYHHPACLWLQFDTDGRLIALKELLGVDITLEAFLQYKLIPYENIAFPNERFTTFYDIAGLQKTDKASQINTTAGGQKGNAEALNCVTILKNFGITGRAKQSTYVTRKEIIERLLSRAIKGRSALLVDNSCKILKEGFLGGYHYPVVKEGPEKEVPEKDGFYEHLMNCLEYGIINLFSLLTARYDDDNAGYDGFYDRYPGGPTGR